jgi:hypothetical protein
LWYCIRRDFVRKICNCIYSDRYSNPRANASSAYSRTKACGCAFSCFGAAVVAMPAMTAQQTLPLVPCIGVARLFLLCLSGCRYECYLQEEWSPQHVLSPMCFRIILSALPSCVPRIAPRIARSSLNCMTLCLLSSCFGGSAQANQVKMCIVPSNRSCMVVEQTALTTARLHLGVASSSR